MTTLLNERNLGMPSKIPANRFTILALPALRNNYIWVLTVPRLASCVVIDPGDPDVVNHFLEQQGYQLRHILVTHHHWDHTQAIAPLLHDHPKADVILPRHTPLDFTRVHRRVDEGDHFTLLETIHLNAYHIPGHTLDHVMYRVDQHAFVGDTLFSCGCGALFEGTPAMMYNSLERIRQLPLQTQLYPSHEYTVANIRFAQKVDPHNPNLASHRDWARERRHDKQPTLPTTVACEVACNPFLRCDQASIQQAVCHWAGKSLASPIDVWTHLRRWKDEVKY